MKIDLSEDELKIVFLALQELPLKVSGNVFIKIQNQVKGLDGTTVLAEVPASKEKMGVD